MSEILSEIISSQGIWCGLFIWLFYVNHKDSKDREGRLLESLEAQSETLREVACSLDRIGDIVGEKKQGYLKE